MKNCKAALAFITKYGFSCDADLEPVRFPAISCSLLYTHACLRMTAIDDVVHSQYPQTPLCSSLQLVSKSFKLNDICCETCTPKTTAKPRPKTTQCSKKCGSKGFVKDGNCDDNNNNCGCGWDGGDCCGKNGKKHQYSYCKVWSSLRLRCLLFNHE